METTRVTHSRIERYLVALASAAVLGTALAPAAAPAANAAPVPFKAGNGGDDKCMQIKNKKKRKRCIAGHEGAGHEKGEDGPNHQ